LKKGGGKHLAKRGKEKKAREEYGLDENLHLAVDTVDLLRKSFYS
jgi:hypothetical protein